jgi:hypothetical protein
MTTNQRSQVKEPELERQGKRLAVPGGRILGLGTIIAVPGIVLLAVGDSWVWAIGIGLVAISVPFFIIGIGALLTAFVARWAARHKSFA